jgi:transcriptional regulator with XRE-family HTH domain
MEENKLDIKEFRKSKNLTQQAFADMIDVPIGRVNAWEQRGTKPKIDDWSKIKKVFENTTNVIINENKNAKSESDLTLSTISDLAKSSVVLAEANKILSEANRTLANNNEVLVSVLRANSNGFSKTIATDKEVLIDNFLQQGLGTLWSSADEGRTILGKYLYEYQSGKQE